MHDRYFCTACYFIIDRAESIPKKEDKDAKCGIQHKSVLLCTGNKITGGKGAHSMGAATAGAVISADKTERTGKTQIRQKQCVCRLQDRQSGKPAYKNQTYNKKSLVD